MLRGVTWLHIPEVLHPAHAPAETAVCHLPKEATAGLRCEHPARVATVDAEWCYQCRDPTSSGRRCSMYTHRRHALLCIIVCSELSCRGIPHLALLSQQQLLKGNDNWVAFVASMLQHMEPCHELHCKSDFDLRSCATTRKY